MSDFDGVLATLHGLTEHGKGRRFEELVRWMLLNDPAFSIRHAWLWEDWPQRRGRDLGIDVVAEAEDGGFWAVQAKCYQAHLPVPTSEVDKFASASATAEFSHRLFVATSTDIATNARAKLRRLRAPACGLLLLDDLRRLELDWSRWQREKRSVRKPLPLRWHQRAALQDVLAGYGELSVSSPSARARDRGQLIMACGTGKTLVSQRVAEKLRSERTLVVLPSLSLLEQTLRSWKANTTRPFDSFAFCSDASVASSVEDSESDVDVEALSIPVHTSPAELQEFLARNRRLVVFATYHSLPQLAEAFIGSRAAAPFDLLVADEAHRTAGPQASSFSLALDERKVLSRRRLFMTATPRLVSGHGDEAEVYSMDDESSYGRVFHQLKFSDAVDQDLLSDYQVLIIAAQPSEHLGLVRSRRQVRTEAHEEVNAESLAAQLAVARAMSRYDLTRVLTFHSRVQAARTFARQLPETVAWMKSTGPVGVLVTEHVSGRMPAWDRAQTLERLRRLERCDRMVVSNARCFGEGVDVPAIDAAAFVDPRESVIDIVQAIGRTMRKSPGKAVGTIVVPVVVADGEDPHSLVLESAWAQVWKVLEAMRSHDDRLDEELRAIARALASPRTGVRVTPPSRLIFELPFKVDESFSRAFMVRVVEMTSTTFERGLEEFRAALEDRRQDAQLLDWQAPLIPANFQSSSGFPLGRWCTTCRHQRSGGKLSRERIAALDALGFVWNHWEWSYRYMLEEFDACVRERRADPAIPDWMAANVPKDHVTPSGLKLGAWCSRLRNARGAGQLEAGRQGQLDARGFVWDAAEWRFEHALKEFDDEKDRRLQDPEIPDWRAPIIRDTYVSPSGFKLGYWCWSRRLDYAKGRLDPGRVAELNAHGFVWDPDTWRFEHSLDEFRTYVAGRKQDPGLEEWEAPLIATDYISPSGWKLGAWCFRLRTGRNQRDAELHRAELDAVGFVWDLNAYLDRNEDGTGKTSRYRRLGQPASQRGALLGTHLP